MKTVLMMMARYPLLPAALLSAVSLPAGAQVYGSLANFDVVNDSGSTAHGFEIDIEGISSSEITSLFGAASRWPGMERYGNPSVTDTGTGVKIVYQAALNGGVWSAATPAATPKTAPVSPSDSCWPLGAPAYGPAYPCDHFGVSTTVATPNVKYYWLVESSPGATTLIPVESYVPNPVWTVTPTPPIANVPQPPQVNVLIAAPQPNGYEFGEPRWVKVTATGVLQDVAVEDLVAENAVIKKAQTQTQIEWQLLQVDSGSPGSGQIDLTGVQLDPGAKSVVYRFEFYQYTGKRDPSTNEALPGPNGDTPGLAGPSPGDKGKFLVAQNAGVNFDGVIPPAPPVPLAPSLNLSIAGAVVHAAYSQSISAIPGVAGDSLTYQVTGLPAGLSFNTATNTIQGKPTKVGTFPITITATDATNGTHTTGKTGLQVADAPINFSVNFAAGGINWPYSQIFKATGGYGAMTYSITGALPTGLSLTGNTLAGKPTVTGIYPLYVTAKDTLGFSQVAQGTLIIGNICAAKNKVINNVTARAPVWIDIDGGLANGGESVIIPAAKATTIVPPLTAATAFKPGNLATFTGNMDSNHLFCDATKLTLAQGLTLPAITLANGTVNQAYAAVAVSPTGGVKPYTIAVSGLPAGMNYVAGAIQGTPTTAGTYTVGFSVSDSNGQKVFFNSTLIVN